MRIFPAVIPMACIALAGACSEQDAQPSNTVARQVLDGGSVSIASLTMASLDPLTVASAYDIFVIKQVCDTLVSYDRHLRLQPALAEHWTVSEDHRVHTFLLTEGALFHDGTPVTAVAVRDSLARAIRHLGKPGHLVPPPLGDVVGTGAGGPGAPEGLVALDTRTLEVTLATPNGSFLASLAHPSCSVVPVDGHGGLVLEGLGSGPMRLARRDEQGLRLDAVPDHPWRRMHLETVEMLFTDASGFDPSSVDLGEKMLLDVRGPGMESLRLPEAGFELIGLNAIRPPFDRVEIREAFRAAILSFPGFAREDLQTGFLPAGMPLSLLELPAATVGLTEARQILAEAGHPGGAGLERLVLLTDTVNGVAADEVETSLSLHLEKAGFAIDLQPCRNWASFLEAVQSGVGHWFWYAFIPDYPDPVLTLFELFHSTGGSNDFFLSDPQLDRALEKSLRMPVGPQRARAVQEIRRVVHALVPAIPLTASEDAWYVREGLSGLRTGHAGIMDLDLQELAWEVRR